MNYSPFVKVGGQESLDLRPVKAMLTEQSVTVRIPYFPRDAFRAYHSRKQRFALTVAHRRAGKTVAEVNEGIKRLMQNKRTFPPPQAAFVSPTFSQGKRNAWPYAKYYTQKIPGTKASEADLTITLPNGGKYIFAGSDNYDSLRGMYLDHCSLDEFGTQNPRVWGEVVRPALSDYAGTATFIGSANGRNHFYDLMRRHEDDPDWLITILKASETGILSKEELDAAKATLTQAQYEQEYECSFDAAVTGAYYGKDIVEAENEGRICGVPYDKAADVYAGWDLGVGDHTAIWIFQLVGREFHFIDYYTNFGEALTHYVDWVKSRKYHIDTHFLPHDGKARESQTGKSRQEFLENFGFDIEIVPKAPVDDGINAVRMMLNRAYFDKKNCDMGIDCLRMYETEYLADNKVLRPKPKHNWASHGADAFRTAVMGIEERRKKLNPKEERYESSDGWMG